MVLGMALGAVLDPTPNDLDHVGATVAVVGSGAWAGGAIGCYLATLARGVRSAIWATVTLIILLPVMSGLALVTAFPVERAIRGFAGGAIGITLGLFFLILAAIGATDAAQMSAIKSH
jgi:hypothetical protein